MHQLCTHTFPGSYSPCAAPPPCAVTRLGILGRCHNRLLARLLGLVAVIAVSAFPGRAAAEVHPIDVGGFAGVWSSITIGSDGLGLISYHDGTNGDLKVAHCLDVACSAATTTALDTGKRVGEYTSITIGSDGLGLISYHSYHDGPHVVLKVAHCVNIACTAATTATIDTSRVVPDAAAAPTIPGPAAAQVPLLSSVPTRDVFLLEAGQPPGFSSPALQPLMPENLR